MYFSIYSNKLNLDLLLLILLSLGLYSLEYELNHGELGGS